MPAAGLSVAGVLSACVDWAAGEYTKFGAATAEYRRCRRVAKLVNATHGPRGAAAFSPADLSNLQRLWVARGTLSRETINEYQACAVRAFRWAVGAGLIPAAVAAALREVPKLKPGRTAAAEPKGVGAVEWDTVLATLPHLSGLDNLLVAHSRAPFTGPRKIHVAMSEPCTERDITTA